MEGLFKMLVTKVTSIDMDLVHHVMFLDKYVPHTLCDKKKNDVLEIEEELYWL